MTAKRSVTKAAGGVTRWRDAGLTVDVATGDTLRAAIPDIAALRIAVFRDFPYLYDGDAAYERDYLATFAQSPDAIVVLAKDGARVIGASTGAPLTQVEHDWSAPFHTRGEDIDDLFYCAESVLLPQYRGLGLGHAFFDHREAHARTLGATRACFCSVIRPDDHPARPPDYRPNDAFWKKRGYAPLDGITATFAWKDMGDTAETEKRLQFWGKALSV